MLVGSVAARPPRPAPRLLLPLFALAAAAGGAQAQPFHEVDPHHTSPAFQAYVEKGLAKLRAAKPAIGPATAKAIGAGKVRLDELSDLTRGDFLRLRKELLGTGPDLDPDEFARLHDRRTHAARAIKKAIDGYQWDDRIYVAPGLGVELLAETLVHEVNHVLNRSEEHYRGAKNILREEYRAFYCEKLLRGERPDAARAKQIKAQVIRDYGLKGVTPADVPDVPPGILIPR